MLYVCKLYGVAFQGIREDRLGLERQREAKQYEPEAMAAIHRRT